MGQKDITEKTLADYNDVFADIVNVLLFNGKQVVSADSLESVKDKSQYKIDGAIHEEERDVSKLMREQNVKIAMLGLEHQTSEDADEPIRVIGYDGVSYRSQMLHKQKERFPVVTLVLYFGTKPWRKGTSLYDVLPVSDEWKPYVNNYKINLFEIAFLSPEQVSLFQSDFRIVADYFVQLRTNKDYEPSNVVRQHDVYPQNQQRCNEFYVHITPSAIHVIYKKITNQQARQIPCSPINGTTANACALQNNASSIA